MVPHALARHWIRYGTWLQHGSDIPVTFADGDRLGAQARADGTVVVYQNATPLGQVTISSDWPYRASGGHIGIWTINAGNTILDNVGGGTASFPR